MGNLRMQLLTSALFSILMTIHLSFQAIVADEYSFDDYSEPSKVHIQLRKDLTPEEKAIADEANAKITKTIEKNLARILSVSSKDGLRKARQDDEDETYYPGTGPVYVANSNGLPPVAQILTAILGGNLNISRVVNQTYGLVPNTLREQVGGIVKLLVRDRNAQNNTTGEKLSRNLTEDVELEVEKPLERSPRGVMDNFIKVLGAVNLNSTNVTSQVPTLFEGAMGAINLLDRLGLLERITDFIEYETQFFSSDF